MSAYDQHLAGFHRATVQAWCSDPLCGNHDGAEVVLESEFGQRWLIPERCLCGGAWLEDAPVAESPFDPGLSEAENRGS